MSSRRLTYSVDAMRRPASIVIVCPKSPLTYSNSWSGRTELVRTAQRSGTCWYLDAAHRLSSSSSSSFFPSDFNFELDKEATSVAP